jgi:hypothetical protein
MAEQPTNLTDATRNERMKYYVFQCTSLHPDQRQEGGQKPTEGCLKYCIKGSKKTLRYMARKQTAPDEWVDYETILQGRCLNHPENKKRERKQRLNEDYLYVLTFTDRRDAQSYIDMRNGEEEYLGPKKKPEGVNLNEITFPKPLGKKGTSAETWAKLQAIKRRQNAEAEAEWVEEQKWRAEEYAEMDWAIIEREHQGLI